VYSSGADPPNPRAIVDRFSSAYGVTKKKRPTKSCLLCKRHQLSGCVAAGVDVADIVLAVCTFNVARGFIVGAAYNDFASVNCAM